MTGSGDRPGGGVLVLVATPIGNLGDLSPRAVEELAGADVVACEDTRKAGKLLEHAGVKARQLLVVHDHNESERAAAIVERLGRGERIVLISDAGHARHLRSGRAAGAGRGGRRPRRSRWCPGPSAALVGAGGERPARRSVRVRGVPAPQGLGRRRAARGAARARRARSCCTRRRTASSGRWPTSCDGRGRRPAGGAGPRADQDPPGGVAGHPGRRAWPTSGPGSLGASSWWCWPGPRPGEAGDRRRHRRCAASGRSRPGTPPGTPSRRWRPCSGVPKRRVYDLANRR